MKAEEAVIYLAACAVHNWNPKRDVIGTVSLDELYAVAHFHQIEALLAEPLQKLELKDPRFTRELVMATWRNIVLESYNRKVCDEFEEAGIWYMPLKGNVIKQDYPKPELRQMSDVDILIDAGRMDDADQIMKRHGFYREQREFGHHIRYRKDPFILFEIHNTLFEPIDHTLKLNQYYLDVSGRLIRTDGRRYEYHFSDEDFYIYMQGHMYKHFMAGGAGLRSLLDIYVFLKDRQDRLDWDYVGRETEKIRIREFEEENRNLAMKLFASAQRQELVAEERSLLHFYLTSGAYGTLEHDTKNKIKETGLIPYLLQRVFLPTYYVKYVYPFFYKHKILLPVLPLYRLIKLRKNAAKEIKVIGESIFEKTDHGS